MIAAKTAADQIKTTLKAEHEADKVKLLMELAEETGHMMADAQHEAAHKQEVAFLRGNREALFNVIKHLTRIGEIIA